MSSDVIQAQYDELANVARRFGSQARASRELTDRLQRAMRPLEGGGWQGLGSDAFFSEMRGEVLPAMRRLADALGQAQKVTLQIKALMQEAERDAASPFRGAVDRVMPVPQPRIYIVNGINSLGNVVGTDRAGNIIRGDDDSIRLEALLQDNGYAPTDVISTPAVYLRPTGTHLTGTNWTGTDFGGLLSPIDWFTDSAAAFTNVATNLGADAVNTVSDVLIDNEGVSLVAGIGQVYGEYLAGGQGAYTQQTYDFISQDLRNNPLLPDQSIVLMGHSGGGAIVANLAGEIEQGTGADVSGIVTMGSPVSNYDTASRYAEQIVEVRHQDDWFGTPIIRTDESSWLPLVPAWTVATETTGRDLGDHPAVTEITLDSPADGVRDAHGSYLNSTDMLEALNRLFPEMHLDVNGSNL